MCFNTIIGHKLKFLLGQQRRKDIVDISLDTLTIESKKKEIFLDKKSIQK